MKEQGTEPLLQDALIIFLDQWAQGQAPDEHQQSNPFWQNQNHIGWEQVTDDGWVDLTVLEGNPIPSMDNNLVMQV